MNGDKNPAFAGFFLLYEKERKKVDKKLIAAFKNRKPASLYEPAAYILEGGGKRLRPLLVLLSAKAVGGKFSKVYNASVAVELLHNFTLVHDDIMDNADKRRGKPTLHKKYDLSTAILVGDILLAIAYEFLLKDCSNPALRDKNSKLTLPAGRQVLSAFTKGLVEVCAGQIMDKDFETMKEVPIQEYMLMIKKKTAALAEMCCTIGALLANGSEKEIKALAGFGRNIGIAFQIQDDLLDIDADENEFGKFVGGDLVEGKKTYLFLKALEKAEGNEKNDLIKLIEDKGTTKDQIPRYKELYIKLGVLDDAKKEIQNFTNRALRSINILKKEEDRMIFCWLADSLLKRIK